VYASQDRHQTNVPPPQSASPADPLLNPATPGARPAGLAGRLRARWWIYALWYLAACLAASAFYAQSQGSHVTGLLRSFGYLMICSLAFAAPGLIVARMGLSLHAQRSLLLALLAVGAVMVAGTMSTDMLWASPPFILLTGNAIWSIEEIDRELEGKK
jgi:hypothetical protein